MAWSVRRGRPAESDLVDEILLAAGKALYLANEFESKCAFVLNIWHLSDMSQNDAVATLERAAAGESVWQNQGLRETLKHLSAFRDIAARQEQIGQLGKAREARNYIAHEGAGAIGDIYGHNVQYKLDALRKLHASVIDLAEGDNIVSEWLYYIAEREGAYALPAPQDVIADYPRLVEYWVFDHMPPEWLDPHFKPDHQVPTAKDLAFGIRYEPWYSRQY